MAKDEQEQRRSTRYFYVTPLEYKGEGKYENLDALSINISEDGLYFQSNHNLPEGHTFIMTFKIPGNTQILEANCEVVHNRGSDDESGFAVGCKILNVENMSRKELKEKLMEAFGEDPDRIY